MIGKVQLPCSSGAAWCSYRACQLVCLHSWSSTHLHVLLLQVGVIGSWKELIQLIRANAELTASRFAIRLGVSPALDRQANRLTALLALLFGPGLAPTAADFVDTAQTRNPALAQLAATAINFPADAVMTNHARGQIAGEMPSSSAMLQESQWGPLSARGRGGRKNRAGQQFDIPILFRGFSKKPCPRLHRSAAVGDAA